MSESKSDYVLQNGKFRTSDGTLIKVGETVALTEGQAKAFRDKFVPASVVEAQKGVTRAQEAIDAKAYAKEQELKDAAKAKAAAAKAAQDKAAADKATADQAAKAKAAADAKVAQAKAAAEAIDAKA